MSWNLLPVNYTDAIWNGLKKYNLISNDDGTVSLQDVTVYTNKEHSFFGAIEANRMNEALNTIMSMVENGTDLYEAFQTYFNTQKALFKDEMDGVNTEFREYAAGLETQGDAIINGIKTDYRTEMDEYEALQQQLFDIWFEAIRGQLSGDIATNLQNKIDQLDIKTDGFTGKSTVFSADGKHITETETATGEKLLVTFNDDGSIVEQQVNAEGVVLRTKTTTFSSDGLTIREVIS